MEEKMNRKIIITVLTVLLLLEFASVTSAQNYASQDDMLQMKKEMDGMRGLLGELKELVKQQNSMIKDLEQRQAEDNKSNEKGVAISGDIHESDSHESAGGKEADLHSILSLITPKINAAGDFVANLSEDKHHSTEKNRFDLRGVDINFAGEIDGVARAFVNIAYHDDDISMEEGYLEVYDFLPFKIDLKLGKFRADFGLLNTIHPHGLPQVDYPAIYREYLGHEGYIDEGIGVAGQFPSLWKTPFKYSLQVLNGNRHDHDDADPDHNDEDKYGRLKDYDDLVYVGRLKNTFSPLDEIDVNWGLSGLTGKFEDDSSSPRFYYGSSDFTLIWKPFEEKYKRIRWQSEVITAQVEDGSSWERTYGLYSFLDYRFMPAWLLGSRYDYTEKPFNSSEHQTELSVYLTHDYSENNRIRLQFKNTQRNHDKDTNEVFLQWIFLLGQHGHL
jgi:hypothetical protein